MLDETTFRRHAQDALESLRKALVQTESEAEFEVEEQNGALNISFEEPPSKLVVTPNIQMRHISVFALSTTFQLDWDEPKRSFVLAKTGEPLQTMVARLITEQLGSGEVLLG